MSQHFIEDLVEDTVYFLDIADLSSETKRESLARIYRIQSLYDTGNTHSRVTGILLPYGYAHEEEGEAWDKSQLPKIFRHILEVAGKQRNKELLSKWYALFVNSCLDGTFSQSEGINEQFNELLKNEDLLAIRELVNESDLKRLAGNEDLTFPKLKDELSVADGLDKIYLIRFLLDLKKTTKAIESAYYKSLKAQLGSAELLKDMLDVRLHESLSIDGWIKTSLQETNVWCWYKDVPAGRRFVWLNYESNRKFLMCHLGLQHKLLLDWQHKNADEEISNVHFYQMLITSLPEDRQEDKKFINPYGGWKFDIEKPQKTLQTQIDHLLEDISIGEQNYYQFLDSEFPDAFFARDPERLIQLMEQGDEGTGIIPNYVLMSSSYSILLSFAFYYRMQGNIADAGKMMQEIRRKLHSKDRRSAYENRLLEPFLLAYEEDEAEVPMPLLNHYLLIKTLMVED